MSSWFKLLELELDEINDNDYVEPAINYIDGIDNMVGEMTKDLKKLYTFWVRLHKEKEKYVKEFYQQENKKKKIFIYTKIIELQEKAKIVERILYVSVRDEFGLWHKINVGLRKGFIVVWSKDPKRKINIIVN